MKLEKLSSLAELISAIAIVITLVYLSVETQQNTTAVQASVRQAMLQDDLQLLSMQMDYPHVMPGAYTGKNLTDDEQVQLISWLIAFIRIRENHWLQFQNGVIDEATWATYRTPFAGVFSQPFARAMWEARVSSGAFVPGFVSDVNALLAHTPVKAASSVTEFMGIEPKIE